MFQRAEGLSYVRFFRRLHAAHAFDWYLEIGCRNGRILEMARGKTIGVDPVFRLEKPLLGRKPALHLFQETSDEFFAADRLDALGATVGVAFIDGMHLYEYALRDLLNTERHADPGGVIFLHDCFPYSHEMTTRDLGALPSIWTGDVWKLIPILIEHRPDLRLTAIDAGPTGLLAVTDLKPGARQPAIDLDAIDAAYRDLTLARYGLDRFAGLLAMHSAERALRDGTLPLAALADEGHTLSAPDLVTP